MVVKISFSILCSFFQFAVSAEWLGTSDLKTKDYIYFLRYELSSVFYKLVETVSCEEDVQYYCFKIDAINRNLTLLGFCVGSLSIFSL